MFFLNNICLFTVPRFFWLLLKSLPVVAFCISARRGKKELNPKRIPKDSGQLTRSLKRELPMCESLPHAVGFGWGRGKSNRTEDIISHMEKCFRDFA